ncbi:hypothetical protein SUGI_1042480 [Cryptomeria japonica]|nr:hypothetical protein SUGI_1042480 [Cryptomeria japonica]
MEVELKGGTDAAETKTRSKVKGKAAVEEDFSVGLKFPEVGDLCLYPSSGAAGISCPPTPSISDGSIHY